MNKKKIRVLIVDDSRFMREFMASAMEEDGGIEVVGKAVDPYEARDMLLELKPDVMTLDIQMPKMNGIDFLKKLMPQYPLPVVVVSAASSSVFEAMEAGAVDFISKASTRNDKQRNAFVSELVVKIKVASIAKVGQHKLKASRSKAANQPQQQNAMKKVIAIGASTGGTEATLNLLQGMADDLPGILVVQHMPPIFTKLYSERLNNTLPMRVKEAENGDTIEPGSVLIAPGGLHMRMKKTGSRLYVEVKEGEKISGHCPSVDALFHSVAAIKGIDSLGIIMTGMGSDGAKGLLAMKQAGAATIGQNKETCAVYGMPAVAYNIGAVDIQLPVSKMPGKIYEWYAKLGKKGGK